MGDTLLPELGLVFSLFVVTRMLQIVMAPDRKTQDATIYAFATVTAIVAGIGIVNLGILVARSWITRFTS
jgi:hypothetical protein